MNRQPELASFTLLFMSLVALLLATNGLAQDHLAEQCSLAVVSDLMSGDQPVCGGKLTRDRPQHVHAFEQAQFGLGSTLVIAPDYTPARALKWFTKAAKRGDSAAQVNLAVMYVNGWGAPADYQAALRWLRAAAAQGFGRAYYNLGILYFRGQGVPQDYAESLRWFQKGASANDAGAETNLGYMYDKGLGCARDLTNAASWYRKAALAGDALAQNNLADMYLRGEGVPRDITAAFHWYEQAARQGHTGARIELGYLYARGVGTRKDPIAAYTWITAAALAGDSRGVELLPSLEAVLSPEQISAAQERSRQLSANAPSQ
jgi:TPR repeat protein